MLASLLDNDLYTYTVGQAVLQLYPEAIASFNFINRNKTPFNRNFLDCLISKIRDLESLRLQKEEKSFLKRKCSYLTPHYLEYLENYRFDSSELDINLKDHNLSITVNGPWHRTIFWEVPLLAAISEAYYETIDTKWKETVCLDEIQTDKIRNKGSALSSAGCVFSDFGTRRRRNSAEQDRVVGNLKHFPGFVGTSNVYLAMLHDVDPKGTMSHQFIMGVSALESLRYANRFSMENWIKVYGNDLSVFLTDTFTTKVFLDDFDRKLANAYKCVRQDSGNPFDYAVNIVNHYRSLDIDPASKQILFSDGLNVETAIALKKHCDLLGIPCAFGIGTHFTNDFDNSPALNIVIKLRSIRKNLDSREIQVVKISDVLSKATGDADALRVANWTFFGKSLHEIL